MSTEGTQDPIKAEQGGRDAEQSSRNEAPLLDANGEPMLKCTVQLSEKVGLPRYSNVDVGPVALTFWFSKGDPAPFTDEQLDMAKSAILQAVRPVEGAMMQVRTVVLAGLKKHYESDNAFATS